MPDYSHITIPSRNDHEAFCDHVIAVERARKERKPILIKRVNSGKFAPRDTTIPQNAHAPLDWSNWDYAIAPEPPKKVLVPWKLGPELLGKKLKATDGSQVILITCVNLDTDSAWPIENGPQRSYSAKYLAENYVELLPDGTEGPCGTWEEQA